MSKNSDPFWDMFSTKDTTKSATLSTKPKKLTLGKGLLSNFKSKTTSDLFSTTNSTSDSLFSQPIQDLQQLSTTDQLIRQQYLKPTKQELEDDNIKPKRKQTISSMIERFANNKLDYDLEDDTSLDQFSLHSVNNIDNDNKAIIERDMLGNVKKQRINTDPTAALKSVTAELRAGDLVVLGMDSDDLIQLPSTASKPQDVGFNTFSNILGMNRTEKQFHLDQQKLQSTTSTSFLPAFQTIGSIGGDGYQNLTQREKLLLRDQRALQPRNKALLEPSVHWSQKTLDEMVDMDWDVLREDNRIVTRGAHVPNPLRFWDELDLYAVPSTLLDAIKTIGYAHPTGIQRIAMPTSLMNRDIIARAQTGSGKTCSFLIPVLTYISKQPKLNEITCLDGPYGIILAPSRELATQIYDEAKKMTAYMHDINLACVIGGQKEYKLEDRIELLIATPGRLVEFINQRVLVLNQCRYVILDEADRMLNEGFEPQVQQILEKMPSANFANFDTLIPTDGKRLTEIDVDSMYQDKRRRTMLYSATFTAKVENLAKKYMAPDYVKVEVGDKQKKIGSTITQIIEWCNYKDDHLKLEKVCFHINRHTSPKDKVIIFVARKDQGDVLCNRIKDIMHHRGNSGKLHFDRKISPVVLHSDVADREGSLRGFKEDDYNVLIATDVAGRGIDVKGVALVINYELPEYRRPQPGDSIDHETLFRPVFDYYTHRCGRTGRAGKTGIAVTLLNDYDRFIIPMFRKFLIDNGLKQFPRAIDEIADSGMDNKPIIH